MLWSALLRGNIILKMLKITSVIASCASACTLEFLTSRHQNQQAALIRTVLDIIMIAGRPSSMTE